MPLFGDSGTIFNVSVRFGLDNEEFLGKLQKTGRELRSLGSTLTRTLTTPIVGFGTATVAVAASFERSMNRVNALTGATSEELQKLQEQAKQLGITTQYSASQAADAMGFLAMAGFEVNEIYGAMPSTLQLAAAAQMDLARAADITSNILTGYNMQVEELQYANDVLVKTFTSANVSLEQLGEAMKYVGPIASAAGVSFEESAAAIGLLGNAGIQGSMAGTTLRQAIDALINPTNQEAVAMQSLGLNALDATGNLLPLNEIIEQLEKSGATAGEVLEIFGARAGPGMSSLLKQGSAALRELTTEVSNAGGIAEEIAETQMEGLRGALLELKSASEGLMIAIGESGLLGAVEQLVDKLSELFRGMAELDPTVLNTIVIVGALVAAIGPLLFALGHILAYAPQIATAATFMFGPWGIAITAVVAAHTLLLSHMVRVREELRKQAEESVNTLSDYMRLRDGIIDVSNKLELLQDESTATTVSFDELYQKIIELVEINPEFLDVIGYTIDAMGNLRDMNGDVVDTTEDIQRMWNQLDSSNAVNQLNNLIEAQRQLTLEKVREQFFAERRDFFGWFNVAIGLGEWQRAGEEMATGEGEFRSWLRENYPGLLETPTITPIAPEAAGGPAGEGAAPPDRPRVGDGDAADAAAVVDELYGRGARLSLNEWIELLSRKTDADIEAMKAEEELRIARERLKSETLKLLELERVKLSLLEAEAEKREELLDAELDEREREKQALLEQERKKRELLLSELEKHEAIYTYMKDALIKQAERIGDSVARGEIARALTITFDALGEAIARHIQTRITSQLGGFGGDFLGGLAGGLVGGLITLGTSLLFQKKTPGYEPSEPMYAFITNFQDFWEFGTTFPASYQMSGRSDRYAVDPHGRTIDYTLEGQQTGQHFDV